MVKKLVLCVDRDDDLGRKAKIRGPIIGVEENIKAAEKLALVDPEDTDVNALFAAVKLAKELSTEVVTLTGDVHMGLESDEKIARQLDRVLADMKPESIVFVTDGASDDQIIPLIQSRVKINAVRTVVVRQSKELEKAYFQMTNFLREVSKDPDLSRLLFAVPGIVLLLLALGGVQALSLILVVVGVYLIIRGFGLEEDVFDRLSRFVRSLSMQKISTLVYLISFVTLVVGVGYAYSDLRSVSINLADMASTLDTISVFLLKSMAPNMVMLSLLIAALGRIMDYWVSNNFLHVRRYLIVFAFIVLVKFITDAGAGFWSTEGYGFGNFIFVVTVGIFAFALWVKATEYLFIKEIQATESLIKDFANKEVYTSDGKKIGKVSRVLLDGASLGGIKVGRKKINADQIVSTEKVVIVDLG